MNKLTKKCPNKLINKPIFKLTNIITKNEWINHLERLIYFRHNAILKLKYIKYNAKIALCD